MTAIETIQARRSVRLFLSSTFSDMQAERTELVERVFPRLRAWCEKERGIAFTEIDLRWGITDEQSRAGQTLRLCLREVDACRPFFLGLLGDRYGSVVAAFSDQDLAAFPWVAKHASASYTELEFVHALQERNEMWPIALIYERKAKNSFAISSTGMEPDPRMENFKSQVRQRGLLTRPGAYSDPAELGEWVYEDLRHQLEKLFPAADPADAETQAQHRVRRLRGQRLVGLTELLANLDGRLAIPATSPIVVCGEAGSGKSTLLAAWFASLSGDMDPRVVAPVSPVVGLFSNRRGRVIERPMPERTMVAVFCSIGATPATSSWSGIVRFVVEALRAQLPPTTIDGARSLNDALLTAASFQFTIVVLDGLDHLGPLEAARAIASLPTGLPDNLRLLISLRPGRLADELRRVGAARMTMRTWRKAERMLVLEEFGDDVGKTFSRTQRQQIIVAPQNGHPSFLLTSLGELRLAPTREELDKRLQEHLRAPTLSALFESILRRWEGSYDERRPQLVRDCLSFLLCARGGLRESELRQLLGRPEAPLPAEQWSSLAAALRPHISEMEGLLTIGTVALAESARRRYLVTREIRSRIHHHLANYFEAQPARNRRIQELPWQLLWAARIEELARFLSTPADLSAAWNENREELLALAAELKDGGLQLGRMLELEAAAAGPTLNGSETAARFLHAIGESQNAIPFARAALARAEAAEDENAGSEIGALLADIEFRRGNLAEAELRFDRLVQSARRRRDPESLGRHLGNRGTVLRELNRTEDAAACFAEEDRLSLQTGNPAARLAALVHLGQLECDQAQFAAAFFRFQEAIAIGRKHGDLPQLQAAIGNAAACCAALNQLPEALQFHGEEEALCRRRADRAALQVCVGNQARVLQRMRAPDYDRALKLLEEREQLARELGDPAAEVATLLQMSQLYRSLSARELRAASQDYAHRALQLAQKHQLLKLEAETLEWLRRTETVV